MLRFFWNSNTINVEFICNWISFSLNTWFEPVPDRRQPKKERKSVNGRLKVKKARYAIEITYVFIVVESCWKLCSAQIARCYIHTIHHWVLRRKGSATRPNGLLIFIWESGNVAVGKVKILCLTQSNFAQQHQTNVIGSVAKAIVGCLRNHIGEINAFSKHVTSNCKRFHVIFSYFSHILLYIIKCRITWGFRRSNF